MKHGIFPLAVQPPLSVSSRRAAVRPAAFLVALFRNATGFDPRPGRRSSRLRLLVTSETTALTCGGRGTGAPTYLFDTAFELTIASCPVWLGPAEGRSLNRPTTRSCSVCELAGLTFRITDPYAGLPIGGFDYLGRYCNANALNHSANDDPAIRTSFIQ